ncbi:hypothetical protein CK203_086687 [Vitis vinifera]|uniref:Uncharacterized protein n=1 Tax=Vitis vinifera TaxID=29760 RepID=A0A438EEE0_VITVI|nr:hypothetical protein CK203_086687 [Vitis vinifera]
MTIGIKVQLRSGYSKGSMSGSNVEEISEQTRGRETKPIARGRGRKDKSRDSLTSMEARLAMTNTREGPVSHEEFMSIQDKVMSMLASMKSMMEALATCMEAQHQEVRQKLAIYKTTMLAWVMATHEAPRVEVPKPHTFSSKRDSKELDNFLWHMEKYFEAIALIDEATKLGQARVKETWCQDLAIAMVVVESLVEYKRGNFPKPKPQSKGNHAKGGRDKGSRGYIPKE